MAVHGSVDHQMLTDQEIRRVISPMVRQIYLDVYPQNSKWSSLHHFLELSAVKVTMLVCGVAAKRVS